MPEYIVFSICLIILSVTGVLKSPCRAVGLSMFEMLYMLLCALALSVFDMTLSVELKGNAGAAVMIFLPALLVEETRENQGGAVAALVLLLAKSRFSSKRKYLPAIILTCSVVYAAVYANGTRWMRVVGGDLTAVQCLFVATLLETCIACGLIPTNTGYGAPVSYTHLTLPTIA